MAEASAQITVKLDDRDLSFDPESTFGSVESELKKLIAPERVLTEICIDNSSVTIVEEEELQRSLLKNIGKLSFCSKEVSILLRESLQLAPQICDALCLDCDDIENFFSQDDYVEANNRIAELSSLVDWLFQVISSLQAYGSKGFTKQEFSTGSIMEAVKRMDGLLLSLHNYLQAQDFTEFRKILTGPLKNELVSWKTMFTEASTHWTPRPLRRES